MADQHKSINNVAGERYFSENLLQWYHRHKRDLPWRKNKNPYYIWVSEIMLQQTRVETVIPYFHRFIEQFPTVDALADAPEEQVLKAWEGLGYYSRARNLQAAVREVKESYGGVVPNDKEQISSLRGVGPYTAGAILSIAYDVAEPAVDGNVMRVLSRYFCLRDDIAKPATRVAMEQRIYRLIPEGAAGDFNQALMELGATVCTPKSPACLICPVMEQCAGRIEGAENELPIKTKAKPPRHERRLTALVLGSGEHAGKFLIRQRPQEGLLARMWELPHVLCPAGSTAMPAGSTAMPDVPTAMPDAPRQRGRKSIAMPSPLPLQAQIAALRSGLEAQGLAILPERPFMQAEHVFSHIRWEMDVFQCSLLGDELPDDRHRWITIEEMADYPFPNVFLRILQTYTEGAQRVSDVFIEE